jgi:hypothetical protein
MDVRPQIAGAGPREALLRRPTNKADATGSRSGRRRRESTRREIRRSNNIRPICLVDDCKNKRYMINFLVESRGAKIELCPDEADELNRWIKSGKTEQCKVERAKIAEELGTRPTRVSKWRNRFAQLRVPGLEDEPRSGRRVINDESVERRILDQL